MRRAVAPPVRHPRLPSCPPHLSATAAAEWRRLAKALQRAGVLTGFDRAALAAYCQAYARWAEAEEQLKTTPALYRTASGHVQQSPWIGIANRQMELMGRYMAELGLTPAARSRLCGSNPEPRGYVSAEPIRLVRVIVDPPRLPAPAEMSPEEWLAKHGGTRE